LTGLVGSKPLWAANAIRKTMRASNRARSGFFKVVRMSTKRLYLGCSKRNTERLVVGLVILLLVIGGQQNSIGADKPVLPVNEVVAEAELDRQLKINKEALFRSSSEQIRIDAATEILFSEKPLAKEILLDALKQTENTAARMAVCKALSQAGKPINQREVFIEPLFEILVADDSTIAKLAAEATLIFPYEQISDRLEKLATDSSLSVKAKLNVIYALMRQPHKRAILKLMDLLDDPEKQVAEASEKTLESLGIPVGKDKKTRRRIRREIERKGKDEFLRDWKIRQETEAQMRELQKEMDFWQKRYLAALDAIYGGITEDLERGKFLVEHLGASRATVRLWAMEKVSQWRIGTKSKLPTELGPILVNLISDTNRDVRLKTAKLLSLMGGVNSAEKLLQQIEIEQDDEVKTELFVALGVACHYAFSPNSGIKIHEQIREKILELASEYLSDREPKKAQKGAEVIKKLLEQDGLAPAEVDKYLGLLVKRYEQENDKADGALRGELVSAMAGLCAQSVYKDKSAKLFKVLFEEALRDETDLVREAAVDGLIYIDKTKALKILRDLNLINDSSSIVRKRIIDLADKVGGEEDLVWLAEKTGATTESEPAWQAMLEIFRNSDALVLSKWIAKFDSKDTKAELSDEQKISFLEIAERKADRENKAKMLKNVRWKLVELYKRNGRFQQAAEYLGMLVKVAQNAEEKEAILAKLMDVYLRLPNVKAATQLVENCLLEKDLEPNNVVVLSIDNYLSQPPTGADANAVLKALAEIKTTKPMWQAQLRRWAELLSKPKSQNSPKRG